METFFNKIVFYVIFLSVVASQIVDGLLYYLFLVSEIYLVSKFKPRGLMFPLLKSGEHLSAKMVSKLHLKKKCVFYFVHESCFVSI